jgi:hypothetical protein
MAEDDLQLLQNAKHSVITLDRPMTAQLVSSLTELEGIAQVALRHLHLSPNIISPIPETVPQLYHPPPSTSQRWHVPYGAQEDPYVAGPMYSDTTYTMLPFHTPSLASGLQTYSPTSSHFPYPYAEPGSSNIRQTMPPVSELSLPSAQQTTGQYPTTSGLVQSMQAPPPQEYTWGAPSFEAPNPPTSQTSRRGAGHRRRRSRQSGPYDR